MGEHSYIRTTNEKNTDEQQKNWPYTQNFPNKLKRSLNLETKIAKTERKCD